MLLSPVINFFILISSAVSFKLPDKHNITEIVANSTIQVSDSHIINKNANNSIIVGNATKITQSSTNIETISNRKDETTMIPIINKNISKSDKFVPSPQLETYFEYNHYPVIPAFPEAKQIYSQFTYVPPVPVKNVSHEAQATQNHKINSKSENEQKNTNFNNFYVRNNFNGQDVPPNFIGNVNTNLENGNNNNNNAQDKQLFSNGYDKPVRPDQDNNFKYYERYNYGPSSNSLNPYENKYPLTGKSGPPITVEGHPYPFMTDVKIKDFDTTAQAPKTIILDHPPGISPLWKRAAKLFATILPIGILISALTPSILTIGPAETYKQQCRLLANRAENLGIDKKVIERLSKPGCEARLLCETAIKEDSIDGETIKNLFWTFISQNAEKLETADELEAVTNAIREKRCERIRCKQIKRKQGKLDDNN